MSFTYPKNVRYQCLRCAQCCGDTSVHIRHIAMLEIEAQRIAALFAKPLEYFAVETKGHEPYIYEMKKRPKSGKCIFLEGNSCSIYACRPVICRFYPFEFRHARDGVGEFHPTSECPGMGKGQLMRRAAFENLLRQLDQVSCSGSV